MGILQDSEFEEASVAHLRPILVESAKEIAYILPGIKLKYIIDQPMNAVFMMERTLGRPKKGESPAFLAALTEQSPLLRLSNSLDAKKSNARKLKRAGFSPRQIQKELDYLQSMQGREGSMAKSKNSAQNSFQSSVKTLLSEKLTLRDSIWRAHLAQQVRYDLILSNALIYPDDLDSRAELLPRPNGTLGLGLAAMPGRSAMEAYGAYLSYVRLQADTLEVQRLPAEELRQTLLSALAALLFPLELKFIDTPQKFRLFKSSRRYWKGYWQKRLGYLKAVAALHQGRRGACRQLRKNQIDYNAPRGAKSYSPNKLHASILNRQYIKFLARCQKK